MIETLMVGIILIIVFVAIRVARSDPYDQGENAYLDGLSKHDNPYSKLTQKSKSKDWTAGFRNAKEASQKSASKFDSHPWKN